MQNFAVTGEVREACRKFAEQTLGWKVSDTGIRAIQAHSTRARRTGKSITITVGEPLPPGEGDTPGEPVWAIFESNAYLVVTPNRGGLRGMPYLYGGNQVFGVERDQDGD